MHLSSLLYLTLVTLSILSWPAACFRNPSDSVLLTNVKTLTLRKDTKTSHRRVPAIPQLKCVGGNGRGYYEVDVMRCKNQGSDYNDEDVQWTCTANLPEEFKLGVTDVICEGYDTPQDPYILKGSCGVEYKLMLTAKGEEKYGKSNVPLSDYDWSLILSLLIIVGFIGWMIYQGVGEHGSPPRNRQFRGGGRGGGGGNDDPYDPPPPYPSQKPAPVSGQNEWRPGFWSGALGGAAAGYLAGNRNSRQQEVIPPRARSSDWFGNGYNTGGSPLNSRPNTRSGSSSSARHQSTGFGSTSRR